MTQSLVVSLAGSSQVAPTYWLNPATGGREDVALRIAHQLEVAGVVAAPVGKAFIEG